MSNAFSGKDGGEKIERKTLALTLLSIVVSAVVFAGIATAAFATNTTTSATTTTDSTITATELPFWDTEMMMGEPAFAGHGGRGGHGGQMGNIEVSAEYNQTVNQILSKDTDVKNLVSQGYNVTTIRPILSSTISGDGTVTAKATTAIVKLQNGTSGYAAVKVDITNAKVTQIVILTRTVIDKSTS